MRSNLSEKRRARNQHKNKRSRYIWLWEAQRGIIERQLKSGLWDRGREKGENGEHKVTVQQELALRVTKYHQYKTRCQDQACPQDVNLCLILYFSLLASHVHCIDILFTHHSRLSPLSFLSLFRSSMLSFFYANPDSAFAPTGQTSLGVSLVCFSHVFISSCVWLFGVRFCFSASCKKEIKKHVCLCTERRGRRIIPAIICACRSDDKHQDTKM